MHVFRPSSSTHPDRRLVRHLVWMLALKACALYLLWQAFVSPLRTDVDAEIMARRLQPVSHPHEESVHDRSDRH